MVTWPPVSRIDHPPRFNMGLHSVHKASNRSHGVPRRIDVLACFVFFLLFSGKEALPLATCRSPLPLFLLLRGLETIWRCHAFLTSLTSPWRRTGQNGTALKNDGREQEKKGRSMNLIVEGKMDAGSLLFRQNVRERRDEKQSSRTEE